VADMTEAAQSNGGYVLPRPAVSVCIPTFNGASWIREAIESALAQDFTDLEVVVCDDASSDETVALARQVHDSRVRVVANRDRVGMARNWNRSVCESKGAYIKFLMQDDTIAPGCVRRMLEVFRESPEIGMVFCGRDLALDEPDDPASMVFARRFGELHSRLGPLERVNDGRALFAKMQRDRFRDNMIGEPTAVMVTREALVKLGLFNVQLRQLTDLEMWLRIASSYRVGFIAEPLAAFRVHANSASSLNERNGSDWLDRVWLLEGLRTRAGTRMWLLTYAHAGKRLVTDGPRAMRSHLRELGHYLRFRLRRRGGDTLHEPLDG
jgi:glycosyltransferase involved in cell wall biosynthesis